MKKCGTFFNNHKMKYLTPEHRICEKCGLKQLLTVPFSYVAEKRIAVWNDYDSSQAAWNTSIQLFLQSLLSNEAKKETK